MHEHGTIQNGLQFAAVVFLNCLPDTLQNDRELRTAFLGIGVVL